MVRGPDPSLGTILTQLLVGHLPLIGGLMASRLIGSLLIATTQDQDQGNPPMTGDCRHPDTA